MRPLLTLVAVWLLVCCVLCSFRLEAQSVVISEFMASNVATVVPGDTSGQVYDWIELHNTGGNEVDLAGWHLTDDEGIPFKWTFPSTSIPAGGYKVVMASGTGIPVDGLLHTNFSLSAGGGYLALMRPNLSVASEHDYPKQFTDVSYGIPASGGDAILLASETPNADNGEVEHLYVRDTSFSHKRGHYSAPIAVTITTSTIGATIRYTTDGSEPTLSTNGTTYTTPVNISSTTVLRARAFLSGYAATNIDTQTYIYPAAVATQLRPASYPTSWGDEPVADYAMDTSITQGALYQSRFLAGLSDLPTLSVASDLDDIFGSGGIYSNPRNSNLEVAVSAEYFHPSDLMDGTNLENGFQVDCGFKVQGGASRIESNSIKHSLSLRFRSVYGENALDYKLFPESAVEEFQGLQLRAMYNNSWIHKTESQRNRGTLIRDQWARDSLIAMGQADGGHGSFVHLYINGLYWGVYNLHERLENDHYAAYNSGDPNTIDANNPASTVASFTAMKAIVATGTWAEILEVVDVDSYIDYYIIQHFAQNNDLKPNGNWRAAGGGTSNARWRFYAWDTEQILTSVSATGDLSSTQDGAQIIDNLVVHEEFRLRLADRLQLHLFNGGALTPEANLARWTKYADLLDRAIIGESARWGDDRRPGNPYTRDVEWIAEVNNIKNNFFQNAEPNRTSYVISKFQAGTWPSGDAKLLDAEAPIYEVNGTLQHGGQIAPADSVGFSSGSGTVYYTTDGSDPRHSSYVGSTGTLLNEGDACKLLIPTSDAIGYTWTDRVFDDSAWMDVITGVGFDTGSGSYDGHFNTDLSALMTGANAANTSCYLRVPFIITSQSTLDAIHSLLLDLKFEDAAAVWINGTHIFTSSLAPESLSYASSASASRNPESGNIQFSTFDASAGIGSLVVGTNVLAIQLMNRPNSNDLLCAPQIRYAASSNQGDQVSSTAMAYTAPFQLSASATVRARRLDNFEWSPLVEASFIVEPLAAVGDLVVSELNYHPADPTQAELAAGLALLVPQLLDADDFEFIEFLNMAPHSINLAGMYFTNGITYTFDPLIMASGERVVLARNAEAFKVRYGSLPGVQVVDGYTGTLSNGGEWIGYAAAGGQQIQLFDYDDSGSWPGRADGAASTMELIAYTEDPNMGSSWRASSEFYGTPGSAGNGPDNRVVINEVLTHTDLPEVDSIELYNTTGNAIDISYWYLSDTRDDYLRYRVPEGTILPANSYIVFDEGDFNSSGTSVDFALSGSLGDNVYLLSGNAAGDPIGFVDRAEFGAAFNGVTLGRWPDGAGRFVPMSTNTLSAPNSGPIVGDVVISEIMYHPTDLQAYEYIEIHNRSEFTVNLANWTLRGGSDFDFTNSHQLVADEVLLLVPFDPIDTTVSNAFRATYGVDLGVQLLGPVDGSLDNSGDVVKLQRPDSPPAEDPTLYPQIIEDIVDFNDVSPWPLSSDGYGDSLQRVLPIAYGSFASSWEAATPGAGIAPYHPDLDFDGIHELLEYALGLNPSVADADQMPLPKLEGVHLVFSYPKDLSKSDITYQVEGSLNLLDWSPLADVQISTEGNIEIRKASVPLADEPVYFMRLNVTR